jgi:hypothetical protein
MITEEIQQNNQIQTIPYYIENDNHEERVHWLNFTTQRRLPEISIRAVRGGYEIQIALTTLIADALREARTPLVKKLRELHVFRSQLSHCAHEMLAKKLSTATCAFRVDYATGTCCVSGRVANLKGAKELAESCAQLLPELQALVREERHTIQFSQGEEL